ncbi:MAG: c-type cytochrome [Rhodocyclaceae bacterium]|nr:c-type cytochrome [Rhodocyclaceae bacterium]
MRHGLAKDFAKNCFAWILCLLSVTASPGHAADAAALYQQHCAACHGSDRIGAMGPALLPESLERLKKAEALKVIRDGRAATQMLGFADRLSAEEITQVGEYILAGAKRGIRQAFLAAPVTRAPTHTEANIRASRIVHFSNLPATPSPIFARRDMINLFLVVEAGDHHVSILDGDKLEVIHRFASRYALHGGPKFTADGRYVFFASRDGWVSKFDIWNLKTVAEIRVALNTRNVAVSEDGKWVIAANYLPGNLVLLDGDLNLVKVIAATTLDGSKSSRVSAVYDAAPRKSFVAALKDIPEIWEISYDPTIEPIYNGMVHDYKMGEGIAIPGFHNPRRTTLESPLDDFFFDASYAHVMGASRAGRGQVVHLDVRKKIADLDIPGMPHLGSGITWTRDGRTVMASPNLKDGVVSVVTMDDWKVIKQIPTLGPGFFMRSHSNTPYAWVDSMMSPAKNTLQIIDKQTLEKVAEVSTEPGKTLAHVEFDRYGKYVLASLWERKQDGGAIIVYDAKTFKEIKRIPMDKPVGKYNLYNKITRSEGTSH